MPYFRLFQETTCASIACINNPDIAYPKRSTGFRPRDRSRQTGSKHSVLASASDQNANCWGFSRPWNWEFHRCAGVRGNYHEYWGDFVSLSALRVCEVRAREKGRGEVAVILAASISRNDFFSQNNWAIVLRVQELIMSWHHCPILIRAFHNHWIRWKKSTETEQVLKLSVLWSLFMEDAPEIAHIQLRRYHPPDYKKHSQKKGINSCTSPTGTINFK